MVLVFEDYKIQNQRWPIEGRHILAQFDEDTIVVYQAYNSAIANFASRANCFGGPFKMTRMSWIKPNFLWMMFRCGWASKPNQECVLAIRMKRTPFDFILSEAIHSSFISEVYKDREAWKQRLSDSDVRLQWDPDHDPSGEKQTRRAIQLGLRGKTLESYAKDWIVDIEDVSEQVRDLARAKSAAEPLLIPKEDVYPVLNDEVVRHLGLSPWPMKTEN
ncbi:MAG: DUF4291 domain-containing protein [Planctomycetota bacterium]|nr:DUF4291 domain-containing protein [Planctomycetota bacterium]